MEKMNKRKAKDILQFIEDRGLSFEIVLGNQGEEKVMVYSNDGYDGRRIHYAIYPIRGFLDPQDKPPRKGYLREAVEFVMDMEEGI
jgi:hypothetical protein